MFKIREIKNWKSITLVPKSLWCSNCPLTWVIPIIHANPLFGGMFSPSAIQGVHVHISHLSFYYTAWKWQCSISDSKPTEARIILQPLKTIQIHLTGFPTSYSRCFWTSKEWHLFTAQSLELWNWMQLYFLWYLAYVRDSLLIKKSFLF